MTVPSERNNYDEFERGEVEQLRADLASDAPGTPLGRLRGLAEYAIANGLCTGTEAKPAELFLLDEINRLKEKLGEVMVRENNLIAENEKLLGFVAQYSNRIDALATQIENTVISSAGFVSKAAQAVVKSHHELGKILGPLRESRSVSWEDK